MSLAHTNITQVYPYSEWGVSLLLLIDTAIKHAWEELRKNCKVTLSSGKEEDINEELQLALQELMGTGDIEGFNHSKLTGVERGGKYRSFNKKHLGKQPDLNIKMINCTPGLVNSIYNGIFIECKIIEPNKSPLLYIENGVRRYVDGEYAWAMCHTFMIAYVRNGKKVPKALQDTIKRNSKKKVIMRCSPLGNEYKVWPDTNNPKTYQTLHCRSWSHPEHGAPGNIEISHIWLDCPNVNVT